MINLISEFFRSDKVTQDIINALKTKLDYSEERINDLYKQIFLDYSTWYVEYKENEMAIPKRAADIQDRRNYVKTRLMGVGTATKAMLEGTANAVDGVTVEIHFKDMVVTADFVNADNNKLITFTKELLAELIPYHLDMNITYKHVNWGELARVTWGDVKKYTWGNVKGSVEGTVEKGLSPDF